MPFAVTNAANQTINANAPVMLITGAARRVGAAIATALHASGARIALHTRQSIDDAEGLAAQLNAVRAGAAAVVMAGLLG